jgi:hypothetical protein
MVIQLGTANSDIFNISLLDSSIPRASSYLSNVFIPSIKISFSVNIECPRSIRNLLF